MQPSVLTSPQAMRRPVAPAKRPTTLVELVDKTPDLPALPTVALATHRETGKPDATASSVATLVATDPALTARVLRLANSAYYGNARQVAAVSDAILLLGMRGVRNLCLLAGTYPWLQGGLAAYRLAPGALLSHSLATAIGSRAVAERTSEDRDAAFTAGLLHDLGKVALAMWFKPADGVIGSRDDERRVLGFDHGQAGGELARRWNLPQSLVAAIACHHMPVGGLEDAVHMGNYLGYIIEGVEPPVVDEECLSRCSLTLEELPALAASLTPEYIRHKKLAEACA